MRSILFGPLNVKFEYSVSTTEFHYHVKSGNILKHIIEYFWAFCNSEIHKSKSIYFSNILQAIPEYGLGYES